MKKPQPKKPNKDKDYEKIGRMIDSIYNYGYIDKKQMYKMTFVKGILGGLGGVIGATVVVALVIWLLSLFNYTPLEPIVDPIVKALTQAVTTEK